MAITHITDWEVRGPDIDDETGEETMPRVVVSKGSVTGDRAGVVRQVLEPIYPSPKYIINTNVRTV